MAQIAWMAVPLMLPSHTPLPPRTPNKTSNPTESQASHCRASGVKRRPAPARPISAVGRTRRTTSINASFSAHVCVLEEQANNSMKAGGKGMGPVGEHAARCIISRVSLCNNRQQQDMTAGAWAQAVHARCCVPLRALRALRTHSTNWQACLLNPFGKQQTARPAGIRYLGPGAAVPPPHPPWLCSSRRAKGRTCASRPSRCGGGTTSRRSDASYSFMVVV